MPACQLTNTFECLPSDVLADNNEYFGHTGSWMKSEQDDEFSSLIQNLDELCPDRAGCSRSDAMVLALAGTDQSSKHQDILQYEDSLGRSAPKIASETLPLIPSTTGLQSTSWGTPWGTTMPFAAWPLPNMAELPTDMPRPISVNPAEMCLQRRPTYAEAAAGLSPTSAPCANQGPAITQSSQQLVNGKLTLVRKATGSFQQGPMQPNGHVIKKLRPTTASAPPTMQLRPVDSMIDPEIASNLNFYLGPSSAARYIQGLNIANQLSGDRQRTPPPTLHVVTANLGTNTHLQIPITPQQASPAVSTPASTSSARSARRTPTEMRDQPAAFRCEDCQKGFHTHDDLRHHRRNHGERTHECDVCDKSFFNPKDLRRHKTTHNNDPSKKFYCLTFGCPYKEKGFQRRDHLQRHINTQHGATDSVLGQFSPPNSALETDGNFFP